MYLDIKKKNESNKTIREFEIEIPFNYVYIRNRAKNTKIEISSVSYATRHWLLPI